MLQDSTEHASFLLMLALIVCAIIPFGCNSPDDANSVGPPTGKTGNEWTPEDFADVDSALAKEGGPEFVAFCKEAGTCKIDGEVMEKFKEILGKYPVKSDEEYDYFAVVVRDRMIEAGLIPAGDPERYQYKVSMMTIALGGQ